MTQQVKKAKNWPLILTVVFIVVGCAAWICQLTMGLLVGSDMSNTFAWGLMIAVFAFFVGFGAGSQFVASYIVLANRKDLMQYVKTAQVIALAGAIAAGIAILIDLGHPFHILSMVIGPNPISPLTWDMIALSSFIVIAIINVIAVARDSKFLKFWMVLGLISAFALQLVEGLLFALMEARVWWHSIIMPIDFIVVAAMCGFAIMAIVCAFSSSDYKSEALRDVSVLLAGSIIVHLILAVIDLALIIFGGSAADGGAISALVSALPLYILELGLPLIAVFVLLRSKKDIDRNLLWGGILVVVGAFCHRLMLLYPAFGSPTLYVPLSNEPSPSWPLPASTGLFDQTGLAFEIAQGYVPNFFEWVAVLLPLGAAMAVYLIGTWFVEKLANRPEKAAAEAPTVPEPAPFEASDVVEETEEAVIEEPEAEEDASAEGDDVVDEEDSAAEDESADEEESEEEESDEEESE